MLGSLVHQQPRVECLALVALEWCDVVSAVTEFMISCVACTLHPRHDRPSPCLDGIYGDVSQKGQPRGMLYLITRTSMLALINHSNINHELCHHADDVTCMLAATPATSTMNSATTRMTSHVCWLQPQQRVLALINLSKRGIQYTVSSSSANPCSNPMDMPCIGSNIPSRSITVNMRPAAKSASAWVTSFRVATQFTAPTGKKVTTREEWHWPHACKSYTRASVGTNGILECKILLENELRTPALIAAGRNAV
jgi:hypothetical protein